MSPRLMPPALLARSVLRTQSDERLTELARHGSDAAFETIVTRYRRSMVRHCGRVVGHSDAEEAVQIALLSAHRALNRGVSVRDVGPWLHAIAHNAALNILRARASRPEGPPDAEERIEHHDRSAEHRQELREVIDVLQSLPLRQREAIVMRELEGLSYDEIAVRLGSSSGAVRQLLNRARNSVRDRLGVVTGAEPLFRWFGGGAGAGPVARLGALASGCALTAKLCTTALIPATILIATPPSPSPARTRTATHKSHAVARFVASAGAPRPRFAALTTAVSTRSRLHPSVSSTKPPATTRLKQAPASTPKHARSRTTAAGTQTTANCRPTTELAKRPPSPAQPQPPPGSPRHISSAIVLGVIASPNKGARPSEDPRRGARGVRSAAQHHRGRPG